MLEIRVSRDPDEVDSLNYDGTLATIATDTIQAIRYIYASIRKKSRKTAEDYLRMVTTCLRDHPDLVKNALDSIAMYEMGDIVLEDKDA